MEYLTAKDIMNRDVLTVPDDMTVHELAHFLTAKMISGAPVVNPEGKLLGVVSLSDIVRNDDRRASIIRNGHEATFYLHGWEEQMSDEAVVQLHLEEDDGLVVRDIMTPLIFKVDERTPIGKMADTMIGGRIHRLIITAEDRVVGIVTTLDMLKAIRTHTTESSR